MYISSINFTVLRHVSYATYLSHIFLSQLFEHVYFYALSGDSLQRRFVWTLEKMSIKIRALHIKRWYAANLYETK